MAPEKYFHRVSTRDAYNREAKPEGDWLKSLNKLGASKWGRLQLAALRVLVVEKDASLLPSLNKDEDFLRTSSILRFDGASESDFQQEDEDNRESIHALFKLVKGPSSDHHVTRSVRTEYALRREPLGNVWAALNRLCVSGQTDDSIDTRDAEGDADETSHQWSDLDDFAVDFDDHKLQLDCRIQQNAYRSIDDGGLSLVQDFSGRLGRVAILETKRHLGEILNGEPKLSDERIFIIAAARYYMRFLEVHITQDYVDQLEVSEDHQKAAAEFIEVNATKWFDLRSERPRNHAVINIAGIVSQAFKALTI
ncbi:hypothetical protein K4K59_013287 [Colletotrichum sp. SAR11_240]|nr:hypothetical protein K4K59_013287 [Colletotrichum sp. SAR11_240]